MPTKQRKEQEKAKGKDVRVTVQVKLDPSTAKAVKTVLHDLEMAALDKGESIDTITLASVVEDLLRKALGLPSLPGKG